MALGNATVLEVRGGSGADTNGGGFVTGASGTDYSQQNSAQFNGTNLASSNAASSTPSVTSATHTFTSADVGNLINISAGTSWTLGFYQIVSVSAGAAVLDRACGTTASVSSGTWAVGGALNTISKAVAAMTVTGMQCYVKATATYSISVGVSTPSGNNPANGICRLIGYTTTRGDGGRATVQTSANITMFSDAQGGWRFENLIADGTSTANRGFNLTGVSTTLFNCLIKGQLDAAAIMNNAGIMLLQSEITTCGGSSVNCAIQLGSIGSVVHNCYIHNNTTAGVEALSSASAVIGNIIAGNTGASSDGVRINSAYSTDHCTIIGNSVYGNGRDGIRSSATYNVAEISNNILVGNTGYGLNLAMTPVTSDVLIHHNAYYNNTSGACSGSNAGTGDITLTGVPFTNAAGGDFSLNSTSGQGAACRSSGFPGTMPGGTGYQDIGALRHQDPAGGGGLLVNPQR